jgi:hypothetical protein
MGCHVRFEGWSWEERVVPGILFSPSSLKIKLTN